MVVKGVTQQGLSRMKGDSSIGMRRGRDAERDCRLTPSLCDSLFGHFQLVSFQKGPVEEGTLSTGCPVINPRNQPFYTPFCRTLAPRWDPNPRVYAISTCPSLGVYSGTSSLFAERARNQPFHTEKPVTSACP